MVPFRWAITSAGKIAADFAHAVRQLEGHEVVAVAARSEAAAREFCARHARGAAAYGGYEAMFRCDRHGADACYVATRPDSHRALCERRELARVDDLHAHMRAHGVEPAEAELVDAAALGAAVGEGDGALDARLRTLQAARAHLQPASLRALLRAWGGAAAEDAEQCQEDVHG